MFGDSFYHELSMINDPDIFYFIKQQWDQLMVHSIDLTPRKEYTKIRTKLLEEI